MTRGQERTRARKQAARQERIRQAKAQKRAKPGGLAGMGVSVPSMVEAIEPKSDGLHEAVARMIENNPERTDVAQWMGEEQKNGA